MRVPMICMDAKLRQFAASFHTCFSTPQRRYFEIVLLALLLCHEARTLTGLLRQVLATPPCPVSPAFLPRRPGPQPMSLRPGARASTPKSFPSLPPSRRGNAPLHRNGVAVPPHPS